jgi:hypothetical protein
MSIREVQEKLFNSWDSYFKWSAIKNKEDNFRCCGLSDCNGQIKAEYIELY